ncbi:hypothetical protein [Actinomyces sp.]
MSQAPRRLRPHPASSLFAAGCALPRRAVRARAFASSLFAPASRAARLARCPPRPRPCSPPARALPAPGLARCPPPASSLFAAGCAPPRSAVRARTTS